MSGYKSVESQHINKAHRFTRYHPTLNLRRPGSKRSRKVRKCLTRGGVRDQESPESDKKANVSRTLQLLVLITVKLLELAVND